MKEQKLTADQAVAWCHAIGAEVSFAEGGGVVVSVTQRGAGMTLAEAVEELSRKLTKEKP